jgi:hypothetical protein
MCCRQGVACRCCSSSLHPETLAVCVETLHPAKQHCLKGDTHMYAYIHTLILITLSSLFTEVTSGHAQGAKQSSNDSGM